MQQQHHNAQQPYMGAPAGPGQVLYPFAVMTSSGQPTTMWVPIPQEQYEAYAGGNFGQWMPVPVAALSGSGSS